MTLPSYPEDPNQQPQNPYAQQQYAQQPHPGQQYPGQAYPGQQPYYGQPYPGPYGGPGGVVFLPPDTPPGTVPPGGPRVLAGAGRRLGARVLDSLIQFAGFAVLALIGYGLGVAIDGDKHDPGPFAITIMSVFGVIALAWLLLYEPVFIWKRGATLGKLAVSIRVVRTIDGRSWPSFGMSLWRWFFQFLIRFVPFGGLLDPLWLLWDQPLHQALHDKVASTVVVRAEP